MDIGAIQDAQTLQVKEKQRDTQSSFGFFDLLDMINPLQHIPVVSTIYRAVTGDTIKPISNIVGGAVFGGPVGGAMGLVNAVAQHETGEDLLGNVKSFAFNGELPHRQDVEIEITAYDDLPVQMRSLSQTPRYAHQDSARYNS